MTNNQDSGRGHLALTRGENVAVLGGCNLFTGLPSRELERIAAASSTSIVRGGTDVFREGDPSTGLWVLAHGRTKLYHSSADGRSQIVNFAMGNSLLELGSALDGRAHSMTATALENSVLLLIPRRILLDLNRRYDTVVQRTIDELCSDLRQRDIVSTIAALKDARGTVVCAILQLAWQYGEPMAGGVRIGYQLSRQDLADRAGIRIETVIRILSDLRHENAIITKNHMIEITDLGALQRSVACHECLLDCSVFARSKNPIRT